MLDLDLYNNLEIYYSNYVLLEGFVISRENGEKCPNLANYYRLLKLFTNCNRIGGMYKTNAMEGVKFSGRNRNNLLSVDCLKLYKTSNPIDFIKGFIMNIISKENTFDCLNPFSSKKFILSWLTLKVINAEKTGDLLDYFNGWGTGIAVYYDPNENCIFRNQPISLANSWCGFAIKSGGGVKSRINHPNSDNWNNKFLLDTPFAGISYEMYSKQADIDSDEIQKAIEENDLYIEGLLKSNNIQVGLT